MTDSDTDQGGATGSDGSNAVAALEAIADPVVAVDDTGRLTIVNHAARDAFSLPDGLEGQPAAAALGDLWSELADPVSQTAVGTVREIELPDEQFDARVHRGETGATITFDGNDGSPKDDRLIKERAINEAPVGITISDPDREDNPLVYVNEAYERLTGYSFEDVAGRNCRLLQGPDSDPEAIRTMREAIDDEEPVTVELKNYRKDGTEFWNEVTIAPIRNDAGEVTNYVGFQQVVTARKEAELEAERRTEELQAERAELRRVLDRVEGLVQDVTAAVAGSTSRTDLESTVCERIAEEPAYDVAWIGEHDPRTGAVEPRTGAPSTPTDAARDGHPTAAASDRGEPVVETTDGEAHAAFPLVHNDVDYGVLTVVAADESVFDERETIVLSALARAVASGINARETSRILATDAVTVVDLALTDDSIVPVDISKRARCSLEYHRSVRDGDDPASLYTVTGASVAELADAVAELDGVEMRPVVERENEALIELSGEDRSLVEWLSDRGAVATEISAEDGQGRVTFEMPQSANVRSVVEALEERHSGTDVRSLRQQERTPETRQEFAARLENELTDRQLVALRRAYLGGYFEWPRPTTGEELARSMDVSRPTFHEHLRAAEEKLCRAMFEE